MIFIPPKLNIVGKRIGIFDVIEEVDGKRDASGSVIYRMKCSICGSIVELTHRNASVIKVCRHIGLGGHRFSAQNTWHIKRLKNIYCGILTRCYSENCKSYKDYGARGIKMCQEWLDDASKFEEWALANGYSDELTIDRINVNGNYEPDNCRWVTKTINSQYTRQTIIIDVDGVSKPGNEWARICKLSAPTINALRRRHGEEIVKEFIRRRLKDVDKPIGYNSNLLKIYGLKSPNKKPRKPKDGKHIKSIKDGIETVYVSITAASKDVKQDHGTIKSHLESGTPDKNGYTWEYVQKQEKA